MYKTISAITSLLIANSALAINNTAPTICEHEKLMQCLNITSKECTQSIHLSLELCTSNIDLNNDEYDVGEITKKITPCLSVQFLNQSGLTQSKMETCNKEFHDSTRATLKWLEKETKEADDRFFNEDDHLHNYSE